MSHSKAVITATPTTRSATVAVTTTFAWRLHRRGVKSLPLTSASTGKPRPPTITATAMDSENTGDPTNPSRLSG